MFSDFLAINGINHSRKMRFSGIKNTIITYRNNHNNKPIQIHGITEKFKRLPNIPSGIHPALILVFSGPELPNLI